MRGGSEPVYFVSSSDDEHAEIEAFMKDAQREVRHLVAGIVEILDIDLERVVRAKAAQAFIEVRLPIIVEHAALSIDWLDDLPGPLIKPMWARLGARLCDIVPPGAPRTARAMSAVCFCDGARRHVFSAEIAGVVTESPRGADGIGWDSIFVPEGESRTFAEMSEAERVAASPFGKALRALRQALKW